MTQAVEKVNRNNQPVKTKRMKSRVPKAEEVVWPRDTGNPITDNAIENNDLTMIITFQKKQYDVRSPNHKIVRKLRNYRKRSLELEAIDNEDELTTEEANELMDVYDEYEDDTQAFIEDMIVDLKFKDIDRLGEDENDWLADFCWDYYTYSKKKSRLTKRER